MTDIQKFLSDIQRIKKHERLDNGGRYDGKRVCTQISALFERNNRNVENLAREIGDYWLNTYALASENPNEEPLQVNMDRITAFQSFLDGESEADFSILTGDDWETLRDFVNFEAEEIDLNTLQAMMSIILERGAL